MTTDTTRARLVSLHRYPVKGFAGERLSSAALRAGAGLPFDRALALANGERPVERGGAWTPCQAFVRLTKNPDLLSFGMRFDEATGTAALQAPDGSRVVVASGRAGALAHGDGLAGWFGQAVKPAARLGPAQDSGRDGYWDHEDAALSLVNLETVALLERHAGRPLDPLRFRANLYVDGLAPGSEYALVGRRVRVGGPQGPVLEILRPIDRCRATSIDPATGDRGLNVPALLARALGHVFCGVYARVVEDGCILPGDRVSDLGPAATAARDGARAVTAPPVADWPRMARVAERVPESASVTSLWLDDPLGGLRPPPRAGQHLRVHLVDTEGRATWRAYTISGVEGSRLRLSVKRDGAVSAQLQDIAASGASLLVSGPFGDVVLPPGDPLAVRPLVLLSAGIGITPTVAMLRQLAAANDRRRVLAVHVARDEADLALWAEALAVARRLPGASTRLHLTRAPEPARVAVDARAGRPDWEALWAETTVTEADAFLCGPRSFLADARAALERAGVAPERVRSEVFVSPRSANVGSSGGEEDGPARHAALAPVPVRFAASGLEAAWTEGVGSLLDLAEAVGLSPPANCRSGACATCRARLLSGSVVHDPEPALPLPAGRALLCCARPAAGIAALVIDL